MFLLTKIKSSLISFAILISLLVTGSLYAQQQGSYIGDEPSLESSSLLTKASMANFENGICAKIFEDNKNSYYAVDVSQLTSQYEKIRLLELSYKDRVLVSLGSDSDVKYYFYLVNNTLDRSSTEVAQIVTDFLLQSKDEENALNSEQLRLWLIQHDKHTNK